MAKETSIFFNATTYVSSLPDEMRYSIKSISTEVPPSRSHLKRFEKIKKDIYVSFFVNSIIYNQTPNNIPAIASNKPTTQNPLTISCSSYPNFSK